MRGTLAEATRPLAKDPLAVRCRGITKSFPSIGGDVWALRGIDLDVPRQGITMLVGPSGCGKTTLISVVAGILTPDGGECTVLGSDLATLSNGQRIDFRAKNVGFIFQQFNLLPSLSVAENVGIPLIINGMPRRTAIEAATDMLGRVGLGGRSGEVPTVLSGGEQQRVAIARALVHAPRLVVCDEPTSALDHDTGQVIMQLILTMVREQGTTVLIVTHDNRIFAFADRIARMDDGRIVGIDVNGGERGDDVKLPPLRYILPVLGLAGFGYAIFYTLVVARPEPPEPNQLAMPAESRYPNTVSGSGLVEANTRNVAVSSFEAGVVARVAVVEGQRVAAGDVLFSLDTRVATAQLAEAERSVGTADARVAEAEAILGDREDQYNRVRGLERGVTVTEDRLMRAKFAFQSARTAVIAAEAQQAAAAAALETARVTLDRLTVRAPVAGRVLKVNIRPGEYVAPGITEDPPVLMGDDRPLHLRVQIDENDVWRLKPDAPAEAVVRGNRDLRFPLTFVRVEPYVMPKRSLTGDTMERIDTRVLELIYRFDPGNAPVYIGQQMDVFIDADNERPQPRPLPDGPATAGGAASN